VSFILKKWGIFMNINNIYVGTKSIVKDIEDGFISTRKVNFSVFYLKNNRALDIFTNNKLFLNPYGLEIGEQFVDVKNYDFKPFLVFKEEIEKILNIKIIIKNSMSKKEIFRLFNDINSKLKEKEEEKKEKKKVIKLV